MRRHSFLASVWPPVVVFVAAMLLMEGFVRWQNISLYLLPTPSSVLTALFIKRDTLLPALWTTCIAAVIGFFCSALIGICLAIALSSSTLFRRAFYPYTLFFQTVPIVAIAPLLVVWCGPGLAAVATTAFIVSVFPVITNTLTGLLSTDPALLDLFRLHRATRVDTLLKLQLPFAPPNIFSGLRVAAGLAVIGTVIGEFLVGEVGENEGLGVRIASVIKNGHTDEVFAAIVLASMLGLALFMAVNAGSRHMLKRWHASEGLS